MPDDSKRVARLLEQVRSRVGRVEQAIARDDAVPNELEVVTDRADGTETVSQTEGDAGAFTFDSDSFDGGSKWQ